MCFHISVFPISSKLKRSLDVDRTFTCSCSLRKVAGKKSTFSKVKEKMISYS